MKNLKNILESRIFISFITAVIIINAFTLGLETSAKITSKYGLILSLVDKIALTIFTLELMGKLLVYRFNFFKDGWNIFDFIIVVVSLIPASGPFSVLRAFRIFRTLRLLSIVPSMRRIIQAIFISIPGILSVGTIIILIFYISSVLTTNFFGNSFYEWFGTIGSSMYTLFQIMTLESWSMGIVRPVMKEYPLAWLFFVPFILVTTFAILNLFIGIIVDAMQQISGDDKGDDLIEKDMNKKMKSIENQLKEIKNLLNKQNE
jgi:voltage-gated sodium channel